MEACAPNRVKAQHSAILALNYSLTYAGFSATALEHDDGAKRHLKRAPLQRQVLLSMPDVGQGQKAQDNGAQRQDPESTRETGLLTASRAAPPTDTRARRAAPE